MADGPSRSGPAHAAVCVACPMLCDDLRFTGPGGAGLEAARACGFGRRAIAAAGDARREVGRPVATIDAAAAEPAEAVARAAGALRSARRVLVTGLASVPIEAQQRAADVAEWLDAAFDTGSSDGAVLAGPTIARAGEVTAAWEELRDRADCVVLWFVDPAESHPRFIERFLPPKAGAAARSVWAVGPVVPALGEGVVCRHVPASADAAVAMARGLSAAVGAVSPADTREPLSTLVDSMAQSRCVAIVTGGADDVGLSRWAVARLVRRLAHRKPAFEVRLGPGIAAGGGNAAGAAAVATWRFGAAGAIAAAGDRGGRFEPAESDGRRLLERGEVDAVLVVGGLSASLRESLRAARAASDVAVVWLGAEAGEVVGGRGGTVFLRAADPLLETAGSMLREDGRLVVVQSAVAPEVPTMVERLAAVLRELES